MPENPTFTITRTIYDPAIKDFVFDSGDGKALPNIKEWINSHNPVIYWYILRIDNPTDIDIFQWAVEIYTHQALTIVEAYIDGSDRRFHLKKKDHDDWKEEYMLSIPKEMQIPIVSKGTRRLYFKIDINCKEVLMHEYGISGIFKVHGMHNTEINEKRFQYSCKVGEFKQIFDISPDEASAYAEKRLKGKYSPNYIHIFTNTFRLIHELSGYCHSNSEPDQDMLISKLQPLKDSFETVPEISGRHIIPLLRREIEKLTSVQNITLSASSYLNLCNKLVEYLHIEVMGAEVKSTYLYSVPADDMPRKESVNAGQKECPVCGNVITESNKSIICMNCRGKFCLTCEGFYRIPRKIGEKPLCEQCFNMEEVRKGEDESIKNEDKDREEREEAGNREREEQKTKDDEESIKIQQEEQTRIKNEKKDKEKQDRLNAEQEERVIKLRKEQAKKEKDRKEKEERSKIQEPSKNYTNSIGMKFTLIPSGEFMMGSEEFNWEKPVHKVKISKPFYFRIYPVTQKEWKVIMGTNPSPFKGDNLPVESVSWNDVQDFIKKLNNKEGTNKYRLPSEAEWEYAARAGTITSYSFGDDESKLGEYAWYDTNSGKKTHNVGQKKPNKWGLYDMHGNVLEWVQDKYHNSYDGAPTDGSSWESEIGSYRVYRGGSWDFNYWYCRSAFRGYRDPDNRDSGIGFRLLRVL